MNRKSILVATLTSILALGLVACSKSEEESMAQPSRISFSSAVMGSSTAGWTGKENVAVSINGTVSPFTAMTNGDLQSAQPLFWEGETPKKVSAWYCGDNVYRQSITEWTVAKDQTTGIAKNDLLYAPEREIIPTERDKQLTFYHQVAQVVLEITSDRAISEVTIGGDTYFAISGRFTAPTKDFATWTSKAVYGVIKPYVEGNTYRALVIPQDASGREFVHITYTDGLSEVYTPKTGEASLKAGQRHTFRFTITKQETKVEVENQPISGWGDQGHKDDSIII